MNDHESDVYKIALSIAPHVGGRRARLLINHFGSASAIFEASTSEVERLPGISKKISQALKDKALMEKARREVDFIQKNEIQLLYFLEDNYPQNLKHHDDAPICLFYKGSVPINQYKLVSIIGTRKPTTKGRWISEKLVQDLKEYGIATVSGLAYGVDIAVHKASLKYEMPTIGVVAHGLDSIYPSAHKNTAREMVRSGGLITEFVSGTQADRDRFPARNRIIAGMCDALIVVESRESGGSMITANFANDYNNDVFAVPGRIDDEQSKGCNLLIKQHKAHLLESVADLAKTLRWEPVHGSTNIQKQKVSLNRDEEVLVKQIEMGNDTKDSLAENLSLSHSEIAMLLLELEMKGVVKALPGNRYMRNSWL